MVDELALEDDADEEEDVAEVMSMSSVAAVKLDDSRALTLVAVPEQQTEGVSLKVADEVEAGLVTATGEAAALGLDAVRRPGSTLRMEVRIPMVHGLGLWQWVWWKLALVMCCLVGRGGECVWVMARSKSFLKGGGYDSTYRVGEGTRPVTGGTQCQISLARPLPIGPSITTGVCGSGTAATRAISDQSTCPPPHPLLVCLIMS
jgi:hypothetical protein